MGADIDALLADYCAANYGAPATQVIRKAVQEHINDRLERDLEMRKLFEAAKKERLGGAVPRIVQLKPNA